MFCYYSRSSVCDWHLYLIKALFFYFSLQDVSLLLPGLFNILSGFLVFFFSFSELNQTFQWIEDPLNVFLRSEYQLWKKKHLLSLLLDSRKILFFTHRYLCNSYIKIECSCEVTGEKDFFLYQNFDITVSVRDSIDKKALLGCFCGKKCIYSLVLFICSENL